MLQSIEMGNEPFVTAFEICYMKQSETDGRTKNLGIARLTTLFSTTEKTNFKKTAIDFHLKSYRQVLIKYKIYLPCTSLPSFYYIGEAGRLGLGYLQSSWIINDKIRLIQWLILIEYGEKYVKL